VFISRIIGHSIKINHDFISPKCPSHIDVDNPRNSYTLSRDHHRYLVDKDKDDLPSIDRNHIYKALGPRLDCASLYP